jgi:hypothetical protein
MELDESSLRQQLLCLKAKSWGIKWTGGADATQGGRDGHTISHTPVFVDWCLSSYFLSWCSYNTWGLFEGCHVNTSQSTDKNVSSLAYTTESLGAQSIVSACMRGCDERNNIKLNRSEVDARLCACTPVDNFPAVLSHTCTTECSSMTVLHDTGYTI